MSRALPPSPAAFRSVDQWARQFYEYTLAQTRVQQENDPLPVLLPHRTASVMERAAQTGVILYQPTYETPVISANNEWVPIRTARLVELTYELGAAVDGSAVVVGANKLPFNTLQKDLAIWGVPDTATNTITLLQGTYYISGFYTLTKTSGGAKAFTTYLADATALDTPVGSVAGASLYMPASLPNLFTNIVTYAGFIDVPEGGGTYAMVCRSSTAAARFGTAHGLTGYSNKYAHMSAQLVGLNE